PETLAVLGAAAVFGTAFVLWERRAPSPLLPLGIFRSAPISIGVVLMVLMALGLMGSLFFITFYLQGVRGLTPLETGLQLLPLTAMMAVFATPSGRLIDRVGTRIPTVAGLVSAAVALSMVMTGATAAILTSAPMSLAGVASGMQQAAMQLGGSLGTTVLGAILSARIVATLPGHYTGAGLDAPGAGEAAAMQSMVSQGGA